MAFFKMRKGGDDSLSTSSQPESIEALRRRAKHRLIGAVVLVLIGVVGFPLLFDTQPRPISVDIPIEIPDRNKVKPLAPPAAPAVAQAASAAGAVTAAVAPESEPKVAAVPAPPAQSAIKTEAPAEAAVQPEAKPERAPEPKVAKVEPKPEPKPAPAADGAKARALLEGRPVETSAGPAAADGRFVVQVGAFADPVKARETRLKVEKTGMKTYTHVAETKDGKRIRVRVGPFPTRAEADKAADLIKGLDLPAAVLTL
ncbi:MAG: SPOR domain-containing protein [Haliea sp.]|nr:MAG: SPOR domain-containing protein [Haliea sp.]